MKRFGVEISLLDDAAFTDRAGTIGGPKGLDYIPGGALLGVAARQLYSTLSQKEAWRVFHSGEVRFGCAVPSMDGAATYPMPLSWHEEKNRSTRQSGHLDCAGVWNGLVRDLSRSSAQLKQLRGGYVAANGRLTDVKLQLNMMTAIDPGTRRAAEAQLFGYQMIPEGTRFIASIEADDSIGEATWLSLREVFDGEIRVGHSRSALGTARASVFDDPPRIPHGDTASKEIVLWLLSDLATLTPDGVATLQPRAEWLGLPPGELDVQRSFMRFRRYSPWNAKRGGYDLERLVISQGSVLVYQLESLPKDSLTQQIERGLGLYRQCGLGRVWANPALLHDEQPVFDAVTVRTAHKSGERTISEVPNKPDLVLWLEERTLTSASVRTRDLAADEFARAIENAYKSARALKALPKPAPVGPSPSQWGSVFQVARDGRGGWPDQLFDGLNAICTNKSKGWSDEITPSRTFGDWFRTELTNKNIADDDWRTLQSVVRRALDVAGKEYEGR